ncbi:MAG: CBS domain-containing protein [Thermoguttaceae bacterium]
MNLQDILSLKGTAVYTTPPETMLADVVHNMVHHNVGAMLVCRRDPASGEQLLGIVTERDLLRLFAAGRCELAKIAVAEVMSTQLITASPKDLVVDLMGVMTTHRIRHVPVLSEGRLVGIVSIGDLLKAQHDHLAVENRFMRDYIQG